MTEGNAAPPSRMHVEYLAACGHDGNLSRANMEMHWRVLKGPDAVLDDELFELGIARARILYAPASKKINIASKGGLAKAQAHRDPSLWHLATIAALAYGADRQGFVPWVLQQPELDRATAGWIFLWLDGQAYLRGTTTFHHDRLSNKQCLELLRAVCARSEQAGFSSDQLGLDPEFESDRIKCLKVIEDGELATGLIVPTALIDRPYGPPQDDGRYVLSEGVIIIV